MLRSATILLLAALGATAPTPELRDGWIRAAPPTAKVLAGYGRLHNPLERPVTVTSVQGADFARAALHEMSMDQGVMRMRELPRLELAPGGDVTLESGGKHLMLFEPKRALKAGDRVVLEFATEDGIRFSATLDVR